MLPEAKSGFLRNNFLIRMLYADVYRHLFIFIYIVVLCTVTAFVNDVQ